MKRPTRRFVLTLSAAALGAGFTVLAQQPARPLGALIVPPGFKFEVFAENVTGARMMALGPQGTVFVGSMSGGVYAVVDRDGDHKAERVVTIATGLASTERRRDARRRALRRDREPAPAVRRHRAPPRRAPDAGRRARQPAQWDGGLPLVEVHRVRTRRPALHVGRRALQRVRPSRDDGVHPADEARRVGRGGVRRGSAQQRWLRVAPRDARTVVHRQRPRHAR